MKRFLCVFIITWAVVFCGKCFAEDNWTVNTIVYGMESLPSVAVDTNNMPIIAASVPDGQNIFLIIQTPVGYKVNEIPDTDMGWVTSFKITSNNELALTYTRYGSSGTWYGSKGSWFDWVFDEVAPQGQSYYPDMDLTSKDIPHIAYFNGSSGYVEHAVFDVHSQQWIKEPLTGFGIATPFYYTSIDIASDDKIMVCSSNNMDILVAIQQHGFWNYLPAINVGSVPLGLHCSFTADNLPAIAYIIQGMLYYAVYINDIIGWVKTSVSPAFVDRPSYSVSLTHSLTGITGIAYIDENKIRYATNIDAGWTTTEIDAVGHYPDLIFDHNDKPLIVYSSYNNCVGMPVLKLAGIGLEEFNIADLNNDKLVNFKDFAIMADHWMTILPEPDLKIGDFNQNAKVDALDLKWLCCNWLEGTTP